MAAIRPSRARRSVVSVSNLHVFLSRRRFVLRFLPLILWDNRPGRLHNTHPLAGKLSHFRFLIEFRDLWHSESGLQGDWTTACYTLSVRDTLTDEGDRIMGRTIGPMELVAILAVAVLLFGGKKIPEVAKGLGEGIRNFKDALKSENSKADEEKKQA